MKNKKEKKMIEFAMFPIVFLYWVYCQLDEYVKIIDETEGISNRVCVFLYSICDFIVEFPARFYQHFICDRDE